MSTVKLFGAALFAAAGLAVAVAPTAVAAPGPGATAVKSYKNCTEAREDGAAPIHRGEDGYADHLDRDGDGIACE
ncbi:excalibur calcium-binding domain-containing protein [Gordonia crocea]|uniref:Excalibur calcium-binding domain-containing protein n=1 Tax=Gordonia crocea TaxID=589162 RepID=A0A7I9UZY3_9ACTN|nr:excalibur calcium-binding domain-containing protein [Gordonia crocea]GED98496.1 hypothetical protein nbrc107697_25350 [Gordonia crocea]